MEPLISVIVPAYNVENYIKSCLDSIVSQTYERIEIVVIDDGSTDRTSEILDQYTVNNGKNLKVLHITNGGVTNARLVGISNASGEWIGFVDSDDVIDQDMYKKLYSNAENYGADISHCGYKTVIDGVVKHTFYGTGKIKEQNLTEGIKDLIEGIFIEPSLCNKLFKRVLFDEILKKDLVDRSLKINEDLWMNYLLFSKAQKSVFEDLCLYSYIARPSTATRSKLNFHKITDPIKVSKQILDTCPTELKDTAQKRYLSTCVSSYTALVSTNEESELKKKIKKELLRYRNSWHILRKNTKIRLYMIFLCPHLYGLVDAVYIKFFQKKIYE